MADLYGWQHSRFDLHNHGLLAVLSLGLICQALHVALHVPAKIIQVSEQTVGNNKRVLKMCDM